MAEQATDLAVRTGTAQPSAPGSEVAVFGRELALDLSQALDEPAWMAQKRQVAWSLFAELPLPTTRDEDWRRTDLRPIKWAGLRLPDAVGIPRNSATSLAELPEALRTALDAGQPAAGRLAIVNGQVVYHELDSSLVNQGVIFIDMANALRQYSHLVQPYFMTECVAPSDGKFAAMHAAFWQGGAFIYVPRDVQIEQPFQVAIAQQGEGVATFPHTLIISERGAALTCIEETLSLDAARQTLNVGVVEIIAGDGSQVTYVDVQRWGEHVFNFNTKRAVQRPDSRVVWDIGQLGGRLTKTYLDNVLSGNGSATELNAVYFLSGRQHLDLDTLTHHIGRGTSGDLLAKGAVTDAARAVFQGMIKIEPSGQQTNSYLKNDNLLLSERARADSIPGLQIDANDVRASHGATLGRADEEHIFYLQSRGIPRPAAVRLIVEGFFASVFGRMSQERVRAKLSAAVAAKLKD